LTQFLQRGAVAANDRVLGAVIPDVAYELTGIHIADAHHTMGLQMVVEAAVATGAAPHLAEVLHHQSGDGERAALLLPILHTVIAHVRGGQGHDLPRVTGVREDLLVAGHPGVEADLTGGGADGTDGAPMEDRSVAQEQNGLGAVHLEHGANERAKCRQRYPTGAKRPRRFFPRSWMTRASTEKGAP